MCYWTLKSQRFIESKKKEKSKLQSEESIAERVKLRKQEAYDMPASEGDKEEEK